MLASWSTRNLFFYQYDVREHFLFLKHLFSISRFVVVFFCELLRSHRAYYFVIRN